MDFGFGGLNCWTRVFLETWLGLAGLDLNLDLANLEKQHVYFDSASSILKFVGFSLD